MATLICRRYPQMRIISPTTGEVVVPEGAAPRSSSFLGGRLDIEPGDPHYELVMAEAARNPDIIVYASVTSCPECGEPFTGQSAKAQLSNHRKAVHFDAWIADQDAKNAATRMAHVAGREGISCDVPGCAGNQTFPTLDDLAAHVQVFHAATPQANRDGFENTADPDGQAGGGAGAAPVATIPAATPSA